MGSTKNWCGKGLLGSFLALIVLVEFNLDKIQQGSSLIVAARSLADLK